MTEQSLPYDDADPIGWTTSRQALASDPKRSAWVSANAGSGKTHVLTQRVIRLLLAGARPSSILCLTYTKAAASEMSNRVFSRLANWVTLSDDQLSDRIAQIEGKRPDRLTIVQARRLFAKALETPGGLKIQTIHAFCEAVLHQFPLEANVAGHFDVLDERAAATLLAEARRKLLTAASTELDEGLATAFTQVLSTGDESGLEALLEDIVANRQEIRDFLKKAAVHGGVEKILRAAFGLQDDDDETRLAEAFWPIAGLTGTGLSAYIDLARRKGGSTAQAIAEQFERAAHASDPFQRITYLENALLTQQGAPKSQKTLMTSAMLAEATDLLDALVAAQEHLLICRDRLRIFRMYEATCSALILAARLINDYDELKKRRSQLDFEDLISKTAELLTRSDAGPWIHYKLDQGIDHILVDEAQDTSPVQWSVIRSLRDDFFSGESAHQNIRTFFAVGDEKQSIYSFQGARPERFSEESTRTAAEVARGGLAFESVQLPLSFRSTMTVLSAVDQVFSVEDHARGLGKSPIQHMSSRINHPGSVEVWDMIAPAGSEKEEDWRAPFDSTPESAPSAVLARRIAERIGELVGNATIIEDGVRRPVKAGDILVLVRKRDGFVTALTRALKRRGDIPVAGADRLKLVGHIAIQDLLALGRFVLMPADDLSLAALLKCPLFNLNEDDLFEAAALRPPNTTLWSHLGALASSGNPRWHKTLDCLSSFISMARHLSVHDFYAHILGGKGGRRAFLARLGGEVSDVLDEFLTFALSFEKTGLAGLESFLSTLELESPVVKRELDKGRGEVRIMTVHASKGLEAPVVFLVDGGSKPFTPNHLPKFRMLTSDGDVSPVPVWAPTSELSNSLIKRDAEHVEQLAQEEYRRLLYVAMTRAADKLVICGYRGKLAQTGIWHDMAARSLRLDPERCREVRFSGADGEWDSLVWETKEPSRDFPLEQSAEGQTKDHELPASLFRPLPPTSQLPRPLSPSGTGGFVESDMGDSLFGSPLFGQKQDAGLSLQKGRIVHRLLQVLPTYPADERREAARRYLERATHFWPRSERQKVFENVMQVIDHPALQSVFAQTGQAEVSIMGTLALGTETRAVSGRIDRIAIEDDQVTLLDFKTNRLPPRSSADVPFSHSAQLAIYRELLRPLYPDKAFECLLVYTENASLIALDDARLSAALAVLKTV